MILVLLSFLERFAHLLPQALRVEIAAFLAERLMQDFRRGLPLHRIAKAELRLQGVLAGFIAMRWRQLLGLPEGRLPRLRGGRLATHEVTLYARLADLFQAFNALDRIVSLCRRLSAARLWKQLTRAPHMIGATQIGAMRAALHSLQARLAPSHPRALDLSG